MNARSTRIPKQKHQRAGTSGVPHFDVHASVLDEIFRTVGNRAAETGGMLGGSRTDSGGTITHFQFDERASTSGASYSPDVDFLRPLLMDVWNPAEIMMTGFVHSHPEGYRRLSPGDEIYAARILKRNPEINSFFLPIILPAGPQRAECEIHYFAVVRDGDGIQVVRPTVDVIDRGASLMPRSKDRLRDEKGKLTPTFEHMGEQIPLGDTFLRAANSYDLDRLQQCRIVCFGSGSAAGFIEDMARCGIGEIALVDPDIVSITNLATQQVYRADMGKPKVEALGRRLKDINPSIRVIGHQAKAEELGSAMEHLLKGAWGNAKAPVVTLICGLTDSFDAQRLVNELALRHRIPSLSGQLYHRGAAVETTFTDPDLSRACHRCILSGRYNAYENGYKNDVGSAGAPIFASTRLNALKGYIALALLHRDVAATKGDGDALVVSEAGQPWRAMWQHICRRNLALTRLSPDLASILGIHHFDKAFSGASGADQLFFDETLWRAQEPEHNETGYPQPCPDCGGTGRMVWHDSEPFVPA